MTRLAPILAALALLAAGCVTLTGEHVVTGASRPPFAGDVKVVMEGAPLPEAADEIAIVTASGTAKDATLPAILGRLREEAAAVGANAVVRVRYDVGSSRSTATGVAVWVR
jgi:hypothetical protein